MKDHEIAALVNEAAKIAREFGQTEQLRERLAHVLVPVLKLERPDPCPDIKGYVSGGGLEHVMDKVRAVVVPDPMVRPFWDAAMMHEAFDLGFCPYKGSPDPWIVWQAAWKACRAAPPAPAVAIDPNLVTLDKRDLFDAVCGAIKDAIETDESYAADDWSRAHGLAVACLSPLIGEAPSTPAVEKRDPDGYAYEYPGPFGGLRFTNGERWNGSKPTRAVPYYFGMPPAAEKRDREADRQRFVDLDFNRWLDESITENGEFSVWHSLKSVHDAYAGWQCRLSYAPHPMSRVEFTSWPAIHEKREPLSGSKIFEIAEDLMIPGSGRHVMDFARAIEKAHRIPPADAKEADDAAQ